MSAAERLDGPLVGLSFQRVSRRHEPRVLTNEQRVRAYRAFAPIHIGNDIDWPHAQKERARKYELDAIADSEPDLTENV